MFRNGYEQYKMQSVNTMTRSEMLLLLYDELIKRLTRAQIALGDKNYDLFEKSVQRFELSRLQAGRNPVVVDELKPLVADLRDAFKEASKSAVV